MIEKLIYDALIVGAGPAGLAAAIRIKQLAKERGEHISVCIIEKGLEIGSHNISGAVLNPQSLFDLFPDIELQQIISASKVKKEYLNYYLQENKISLPIPGLLNNSGNYIISIGELSKWLSSQAEILGVDIISGMPALNAIYDKKRVVGVEAYIGDLDDVSCVNHNVEIHAKHTMIAEGSCGTLANKIINQYKLDAKSSVQKYALGFKELWEIPAEYSDEGSIAHGFGWPLKAKASGGTYIYHLKNNIISIGMVVSLDYKNPFLDPYEEFQMFKLHPSIKKILDNSTRLKFGAKTIPVGGFQSIPELVFPGGIIIGDSAGLTDPVRLKGIHNAIKSGILAAECIVTSRENESKIIYSKENISVRLFKDLYSVRNIRPAMSFGIFLGVPAAFLQNILGLWRIPITFKYNKSMIIKPLLIGPHLFIYVMFQEIRLTVISKKKIKKLHG